MPNTLCVLCDIVKLRRRIASRKVSRVCVCVCVSQSKSIMKTHRLRADLNRNV